MARNFDGTNDNVGFGTDASVDDFVAVTVMAYVNMQAPGSRDEWWAGKARDVNNNGFAASVQTFANICEFFSVWSGGVGQWNFPKPANGVHHLAWTYNGTATTNDPVAILNGVSQTVTEVTAPSGSRNSDASNSLRIGESGAGTKDFTGSIGWFVYHNAVLDADAINRHRWWGRPHGGMAVFHPLVTDKLANEGTATANGTASGSAMTAMVTPVQRPGTAMMGMGIGW